MNGFAPMPPHSLMQNATNSLFGLMANIVIKVVLSLAMEIPMTVLQFQASLLLAKLFLHSCSLMHCQLLGKWCAIVCNAIILETKTKWHGTASHCGVAISHVQMPHQSCTAFKQKWNQMLFQSTHSQSPDIPGRLTKAFIRPDGLVAICHLRPV